MLIFDIGASTGTTCTKYISPNNTIYAFEPCKKNLHVLRNIKGINIIDKAVTDYDGETTFFECNYTNASSILEFNEDGINKWKTPNSVKLKTIGSYNVETIRLDTFIEQHKLQNTIIDLVKIDTQGNDLKVIKSIGIYINNIKAIIAETNVSEIELYKNEGKKNEMLEYLLNKGFKVTKYEKQTFNQEENIHFKNMNVL